MFLLLIFISLPCNLVMIEKIYALNLSISMIRYMFGRNNSISKNNKATVTAEEFITNKF